jgi:hypothetical protein
MPDWKTLMHWGVIVEFESMKGESLALASVGLASWAIYKAVQHNRSSSQRRRNDNEEEE